MPKVNNTIKQRCDKLREILSPEYMNERTSVFSDGVGFELDKRTLEECKRNYKIYFDSWIKDELDELLKK